MALLDDHSDSLERAADELGRFFDHLRQVVIRGLVAERLHDEELSYRRRYTRDR